jgi:hypothetical protein
MLHPPQPPPLYGHLEDKEPAHFLQEPAHFLLVRKVLGRASTHVRPTRVKKWREVGSHHTLAGPGRPKEMPSPLIYS